AAFFQGRHADGSGEPVGRGDDTESALDLGAGRERGRIDVLHESPVRWERQLITARRRNQPADTAFRLHPPVCIHSWVDASSVGRHLKVTRIRLEFHSFRSGVMTEDTMKKIAMVMAVCLIAAAPAYFRSTPAFATCKSDAVGKD